MIINLFSIFDPSSYSISTSWLIPIIGILSPCILFFSKNNSIFSSILKTFKNEIITTSNLNRTSTIIVSFLIAILIINLIALLPFTFTINSQLRIVFPAALTIWIRIIIYSIFRNFNSLIAHLVPIGTPSLLIPLIVLIELTRNLIRPITLSVRLIANLTAGHLLMHLLRSFSISSGLILPLIPVRIILSTLELAVAGIQAYIFSILLTLYSRETH